MGLKKAVVVPDHVTGNGVRGLLGKDWVVIIMGGDLTKLPEDQNRFSDVVYLDGCFKTVIPKFGHRTAKAWAQDLEDNYMVGMGYVLREGR